MRHRTERSRYGLIFWNLSSFFNLIACSHVPHEARNALPPGWTKRHRVEPNTVHQVQLSLTPGNLDKGEQHLLDISDPDSPNYGKHWTAQQVQDFFRPSREAIDKVREWVESSVACTASLSPDWNHIQFDATNEELEQLLQTEFHYHQHVHTKRAVPATDVYHLPELVRRHIDYVTPGIVLRESSPPSKSLNRKKQSSTVQKPRPKTQPDAPCNATAMTPACIAAFYGIPATPAKFVKGYEHGIYASGNGSWDQNDLNNFFTLFTDIPNGTHPKAHNIDGAVDMERHDGKPHPGEVMLDLTITFPLVYPNLVVLLNEGDAVYQKDSPGSQNSMLDALDASYCTYEAYGEKGDFPPFDGTYPNPKEGGYKGRRQCGTIKPPSVIASSWDATEDNPPVAWQRRQCNEFMKLTMQGVSFFYATGDNGIGGAENNCYGPKKDNWAVPWPANCPWVTGVGGTQIKAGADLSDHTTNHEEALFGKGIKKDTTSAGGISAIYDRPKWQKAAVDAYLAKANIKTPGYTALAPDAPLPAALNTTIQNFYKNTNGEIGRRSLTGRGVPDLSALGDIIYDAGFGEKIGQFGGTSASAQLVASMFSRINLERMAINKGPVGFVNPTLYKYADTIMQDITEGHNNANCNQEGYPVTKGWDAVTGLGTLKYKEALALFLKLGTKINE